MLFRYILILLFFVAGPVSAEETVNDFCKRIAPGPENIPNFKARRAGGKALFMNRSIPESTESSQAPAIFTCRKQYQLFGIEQVSDLKISLTELKNYCVCEFCKKNPDISGEICTPLRPHQKETPSVREQSGRQVQQDQNGQKGQR